MSDRTDIAIAHDLLVLKATVQNRIGDSVVAALLDEAAQRLIQVAVLTQPMVVEPEAVAPASDNVVQFPGRKS